MKRSVNRKLNVLLLCFVAIAGHASLEYTNFKSYQEEQNEMVE